MSEAKNKLFGVLTPLALAVFALMGATYACFLQNEFSYNVVCRAALSANLVENGRIDINDYESLTEDKSVRDGVYYCDKAPGMSFLAAPAAFVYTRVIPITGEVARDQSAKWPLFLYILTVTASMFWCAVAAMVLFLYLRDRTGDTRAALLGAIAFGFATPIFGWATSFFGHAVAGAMLLMGFIALDTAARRIGQGAVGLWLPIAGGFALGGAVAVEYTSALPAAIIGAAIGLSYLKRETLMPLVRLFAIALAAAVVVILPVLAYHAAAFGSPFTTGYKFAAVYQETRGGFFGLSMPDFGLIWELTFGTRRGFIWYAPVMLPALYGAYLCMRRNENRTAALVTVLALAWYIVMNAGFTYWLGGSSTGPRYVAPALGFAGLMLGLAWPLFGRWARRISFALLIVSIIINLAATAVDMTVSENLANPLLQEIFPRFFAGDLQQTMVHKALKLDGFVGLVPVAILWIAAGWYFRRTLRRDTALQSA